MTEKQLKQKAIDALGEELKRGSGASEARAKVAIDSLHYVHMAEQDKYYREQDRINWNAAEGPGK